MNLITWHCLMCTEKRNTLGVVVSISVPEDEEFSV